MNRGENKNLQNVRKFEPKDLQSFRNIIFKTINN